ncbi:MAG: S-layer protein, partial [Methanoregula sp.]
MKYHFTLALLIVAALLCITPALGAEKYIGGTPEITAYLSGVNEFSPGQDATITVVIQNSGTSAV